MFNVYALFMRICFQQANAATNAKSTARKKEDDVDVSPLLEVNKLKNQRVIDEQKLKVSETRNKNNQTI